jgi:hypothetical protein
MEIDKIIKFEKSQDRKFVTFLEKRSCKIVNLVLNGSKIENLRVDPGVFILENILIIDKFDSIFQISEHCYYNLGERRFISPDYNKELKKIAKMDFSPYMDDFAKQEKTFGSGKKLVASPSKVEYKEDYEDCLKSIVSLGYKFSEFFGKDSGFLEVYQNFGDEELLKQYMAEFDYF